MNNKDVNLERRETFREKEISLDTLTDSTF